MRPIQALFVARPVIAGGSSAQSIQVNLPDDMFLKIHSWV
jgi:hypothetical protein